MIGDQVVGSGRTAHEARAAANAARPNECSHTLFIPAAEPVSVRLPEICARVCAALPPHAREQSWLVGGAVRAALMGREVGDLDFVLAGDALGAARAVADALSADYFALDTERGVGRVLINSDNGMVIDFARMHSDGIIADLLARDFTINAMALPVSGEMRVLDPAGGRVHLREKRICMVTEATLPADPIRVVRAVRLAVEIGFHIDRETREALRENVPGLKRVSAERMRDELFRCLSGPNPTRALRALNHLGALGRMLSQWNVACADNALAVIGVLQALFSVLRPRHDVDAASEFALGLVAARVGRFRNELSAYFSEYVVAPRNRRQLLYLSALLHSSCTSVQARECCRALRLSNAESDQVAAIAQSVDLPDFQPRLDGGKNGGSVRIPVTLVGHAIFRFFRAHRAAGVEACLLSLALTLVGHGPALPQGEWAQKVDTVVALLDGYFNRFSEVIEPMTLIDGREIMRALGIPEGERVGEILSEISAAQAAGQVTTREQALQMARTLSAQRGED